MGRKPAGERNLSQELDEELDSVPLKIIFYACCGSPFVCWMTAELGNQLPQHSLVPPIFLLAVLFAGKKIFPHAKQSVEAEIRERYEAELKEERRVLARLVCGLGPEQKPTFFEQIKVAVLNVRTQLLSVRSRDARLQAGAEETRVVDTSESPI